MCDQDHTDASFAYLGDQPENDRRLANTERRSRFVENQQSRSEVNRSSDRESLPFTTGERPDQLTRICDAPDADSWISSSEILFAWAESIRRNGPRPFVGSAPTKKLRATLRSGIVPEFWWTVAMPSA